MLGELQDALNKKCIGSPQTKRKLKSLRKLAKTLSR